MATREAISPPWLPGPRVWTPWALLEGSRTGDTQAAQCCSTGLSQLGSVGFHGYGDTSARREERCGDGDSLHGAGWSIRDLIPKQVEEIELPSRWLWVPRGRVLEPQLGFPAHKAEIHKFGGSARRIWKAARRRVDSRSFAEVVRGDSMERRPPNPRPDQWQSNKRRDEEQRDWGDRAPWEREEEELRGRLLGQNQRRPEGRWRPDERREGGRNWQGEKGRVWQGEQREGLDVRRFDKGRKEQVQEGPREDTIKCYNCGEFGHHLVRCTKLSLCYVCKSSGHISSHCPTMMGSCKRVEIKFKGYGVNEQGFYSMKIDVPVGEGSKTACRGILSVIRGKGSVPKVMAELSSLFKGLKWDWKVRQINDNNFLVDFPNPEARSKLTLFKSFDFDKFPIKASVTESKMTVDELYVVWVRMYGMPDFARSEASIKAVAELVGELEEVDGTSVAKREFVRMKIECS